MVKNNSVSRVLRPVLGNAEAIVESRIINQLKSNANLYLQCWLNVLLIKSITFSIYLIRSNFIEYCKNAERKSFTLIMRIIK